MSDLIERLREQTPEASGKSMYWGKLMKEAADEIERLRVALAKEEQAHTDTMREDAQKIEQLRAVVDAFTDKLIELPAKDRWELEELIAALEEK